MTRHLKNSILAAAVAAALTIVATAQAAAPAEIVIPGERVTPESLTSTAVKVGKP